MFFTIPSSKNEIITNTPYGVKSISHFFFESKNGQVLKSVANLDRVSIFIDGKQIARELPILPFCTTTVTGELHRWKEQALACPLNVNLSEIKISGTRNNDFNIVFVCSDQEIDESVGFDFVETKRFVIKEQLPNKENLRAEVIQKIQVEYDTFLSKITAQYNADKERWLQYKELCQNHHQLQEAYDTAWAEYNAAMAEYNIAYEQYQLSLENENPLPEPELPTSPSSEFEVSDEPERPEGYYFSFGDDILNDSFIERYFTDENNTDIRLSFVLREFYVGKQTVVLEFNLLAIKLRRNEDWLQSAEFNNWFAQSIYPRTMEFFSRYMQTKLGNEISLTFDYDPDKVFAYSVVSPMSEYESEHRLYPSDINMQFSMLDLEAETFPPKTDLSVISENDDIPFAEAVYDFVEKPKRACSIIFDLPNPDFSKLTKYNFEISTYEIYLMFIYKKLV